MNAAKTPSRPEANLVARYNPVAIRAVAKPGGFGPPPQCDQNLSRIWPNGVCKCMAHWG
jgi:hypothetical protein